MPSLGVMVMSQGVTCDYAKECRWVIFPHVKHDEA
jgi:hypothetical protein